MRYVFLILFIVVASSFVVSHHTYPKDARKCKNEDGRLEHTIYIGNRMEIHSISTDSKTLRSVSSEFYVINMSTHGWVSKFISHYSRYINVSHIDAERDKRHRNIMYYTISYSTPFVNASGSFINITFIVLRVNYSRIDIDVRHANITDCQVVSSFNITYGQFDNPVLTHLDSTILSNESMIITFSVKIGRGWRQSLIYVYKYYNLSVYDQEFERIQLISLHRWQTIILLHMRIASEDNNFALVYSFSYGYPLNYMTNISFWRQGQPKPNITEVSGFEFEATGMSNVLLKNDTVYVVIPNYFSPSDEDYLSIITWNTSGGNAPSWEDLHTASDLYRLFGDIPHLEHTAISIINESKILILWEGHTEFTQYLFYTIYPDWSWSSMYEVICSTRSASCFISLDNNDSDLSTVFMAIEYSPEYRIYRPIQLIAIYNETHNAFEWFGPYTMGIGPVSTQYISAFMNESMDIIGVARFTDGKNMYIGPLIVLHDEDKDFLGDWEESNEYNTFKHDPDSDDDGIVDGSEIYIYCTYPLDDDSDDDGLDDRFEIEIRPNKTYPEYGGVTNIYKTDPLNDDTDGDLINDYCEVTGDYSVGGRHGYRTNPVEKDTDNDGLDDYTEIFLGLEYWVNSTNNKFTAFPNATLVDTDGDGLSDREEKIRKLNPCDSDTDMDLLSDYYEIHKFDTNPHIKDCDGDGLPDCEIFMYGTDPNNNDTDGDMLDDYSEIMIYYSNPRNPDTDGDRLLDGEELLYHCEIKDNDTDDDGIDDYEEVKVYGTSPILNDTDGDGLGDYNETKIYYTNPLVSDTDSDGLTDYEECIIYGTNPLDPDSDGDRLGDFEEISYGVDPNDRDTDDDNLTDWDEIFIYGTDPTKVDTDGDNLSDYEEITGINISYIGIRTTDPREIDTDGDNITDGQEVLLHTDPTQRDTDSDGLDDYEEINIYYTDPCSSDSDADGLSDYEEIKVFYTRPCLNDSDGDNISDYDEVKVYGTNPNSPDSDGDGLYDLDEIMGIYIEGIGNVTLDPLSNDTDKDGLSDDFEVSEKTNPASRDTDGDGLSDYDEIKNYGTDPRSIDTDHDTIPDNDEIRRGTDPLRKDTDMDLIPDNMDMLLPTFPDYIILIVIILAIGIYKAHSYGLFRNWRKDIISIGFADVGGVPLFIVPEDFETGYDINLISSGLLGIYTMTGEITGKEIEKLVLSGELPIFICRGETCMSFTFIKREYPRLIKQLYRLHKEAEQRYGELFATWSGLTEEVEEVKRWLIEKLGK